MTKHDFKDGAGPVPAHQHVNENGSPGGWVADTALVSQFAYVSPDSEVFGVAHVFEMASVRTSRIGGSAHVWGLVLNTSLLAKELVDIAVHVIDGAWRCGQPEVARNEAIRRMDEIREVVLADPGCLNMTEWHSDCGTAHCLAGWAQVLAGLPADYETVGEDAVRLLGRWGAPMFFESKYRVLKYLRNREYARIP